MTTRPATRAVPTSDGVEGNARLTSALGIVLIPLLAVEGYTVLDVHGMITLHIFLGTVLLGPVLLKSGSTIYRFSRYYLGAGPYVRKGPPHVILRVLGPLVMISSLSLLGTGIALIYAGRGPGWLLTAHQASFIIWFGVMVIHVLGHFVHALVTTWQELVHTSRKRWLRVAAVVVSLALGVAIATAVLPSATQWTDLSKRGGTHQRR
jgi:hypothetical protein